MRLNFELKLDHQFVHSVLEADVTLDAKIHFFKWADNKKNYQHGSTTYVALIRILEENRIYNEIHRTVLGLLRNESVRFKSDLLSELVEVLGRAQMASKALRVFRLAKDRHCKPTLSTYKSLILMLMKDRWYGKIHEVYTDMCNEEGDYFLDEVTYSAVISSCEKLDFYDSAIRLFEEMKDINLQPTEKTYNILLGIYFKLGKVEKGLDLVEEMKQEATLYTYKKLIKLLGKAGRVEEAYGLYKKLVKDGLSLDVVFFNNLMNVLGKVGRVKELTNVFNEMGVGSCKPSFVSYNILFKALFESKAPVSEVSSWFDKMKADGVSLSGLTYSILVDGYCNTNRLDKALLLLKEMDEKGFPPFRVHAVMIKQDQRAPTKAPIDDLQIRL